MIRFYFKLKWQILQRHITDADAPLPIGVLLMGGLFYALSNLLFKSTPLAHQIYVVLGFGLMLTNNHPLKLGFIKATCNKTDFLKIRLFENLLYGLPFMIFILFYSFNILYVLYLFWAAILSTYSTHVPQSNTVFPTPFKKPYEFIIGVRKGYLFVVAVYIVFVMGLLNDNYNLMLASIFGIFLICMFFYQTPEHEYYIWNYALTVKSFLTHKIKIAITQSSMLILPLCLITFIFYPLKTHFTMLVVILGYLYIIMAILSKYAIFPNTFSIQQIFMFFFVFYIPPIIVLSIPFLWPRAIKNLHNLYYHYDYS